MKKITMLHVYGIGILWTLSGSGVTADLNTADFEQVMKEAQAPTDAVWRTIPWKTSLLEAQSIAARERKPLFIWAMDGHPLGCV
jgi:hypothetical protein